MQVRIIIFGVPEDIILQAIRPGTTKFEGKMSQYKLIQKHSSTSTLARSADLSYFYDLHLKLLKAFPPKNQ